MSGGVVARPGRRRRPLYPRNSLHLGVPGAAVECTAWTAWCGPLWVRLTVFTSRFGPAATRFGANMRARDILEAWRSLFVFFAACLDRARGRFSWWNIRQRRLLAKSRCAPVKVSRTQENEHGGTKDAAMGEKTEENRQLVLGGNVPPLQNSAIPGAPAAGAAAPSPQGGLCAGPPSTLFLAG